MTLLQNILSCFRIVERQTSQTLYPLQLMAKQHSPRFLTIVNAAKARIRECTIRDLKARMDRGEPLTLVDVREESEYAVGHIPGAIHLSKGIIERDIETKFPDPTQEILLYCGGGFRSALTAFNLQEMGYQNVVSVDGGWRVWTDENYPVERGG
ncbi:MAG: rhodanese-like domain-containing protein [Pirellula sp.]